MQIELGQLLDYIQPTKYIVSSEQYDDSYNTPVLTAGKTFILGYTNDESGIYECSPNNEVILFDDFTTASRLIDFNFKVKSSACKILVPKPGVDIRYVFYAMKMIKVNTDSHKRYWISIYSKQKIYYPDECERNKIKKIFDEINELIDINRRKISLYEELIDSKLNEYFNFKE
jgi:type I restriction enzyme S subunit